MKTVQLEDDVFEAIQERAEPLVDDINSVLRRILDRHDGDEGANRRGPSGPRSPRKPGRAAPGSILSEREYEMPILQALLANNGRGQATEITDAVGEQLKEKLTPLDEEMLDSGDIRWRNRVAFTRLTLRKQGFLRDNSPRGIWELTTAGRRRAEDGDRT